MATRWTSKHTGKKIDDTIDYVCNPNLLDNWYFGNTVNQRGQTSYTGAGYGPDRWRLFSNTITCRITPDGLTLVSNGENSIIECYLDTDLTGKTVTMSALIDGIVYSGSKTVDQYDFVDAVPFPGGTIRVFYADGKSFFRIWLSDVAGTTVQLKAVKLELGSQQTLAHQDANGNWILNEIPDYGEQLRRCQRYYLSNKQRNAYGKSTSATAAYVDIPTPVTMRALPAIETGVIGHVICNGVKTVIASINPVKLNDESITLQVVLNTSVSVDYPVFLTDTKYALSADL